MCFLDFIYTYIYFPTICILRSGKFSHFGNLETIDRSPSSKKTYKRLTGIILLRHQKRVKREGRQRVVGGETENYLLKVLIPTVDLNK